MNYKIIGKYIKKLDFNIPNPKTFYLLSKEITNYKINIDIKSNQIKEKIIEIETSLNLLPVKEDFEKIQTKIILSTLIELQTNTEDKEKIERLILIDVPTKIYPDLRKVFVFVFENSGFKNVNISEKVDFEKLFKNRKAQ
tara:strand:+ start:453 stop:872 length:420 start_codon:yes stop_codon:yes gene_type:complete